MLVWAQEVLEGVCVGQGDDFGGSPSTAGSLVAGREVD